MLRFREEEDGRGRGEREEGDVRVCAGGSHASGVSIQRTAKQMSEAWVNLSFGRNWDCMEWLECKLLPRQPDHMPDALGSCRRANPKSDHHQSSQHSHSHSGPANSIRTEGGSSAADRLSSHLFSG